MNWVNIGSRDDVSPVRRQAITWTIAGLLSIGYLWINFSEIRIWILSLLFKRMHLKMSSAKMAAILPRERWVKHNQWYMADFCVLKCLHSMRSNRTSEFYSPPNAMYTLSTKSSGISRGFIRSVFIGCSLQANWINQFVVGLLAV